MDSAPAHHGGHMDGGSRGGIGTGSAIGIGIEIGGAVVREMNRRPPPGATPDRQGPDTRKVNRASKDKNNARERKHAKDKKPMEPGEIKFVGKPEHVVHNPNHRDGKLGDLRDHKQVVIEKDNHYFRRHYYYTRSGGQITWYWYDEPLKDSDPIIALLKAIPVCDGDSDDCDNESPKIEEIATANPPPPVGTSQVEDLSPKLVPPSDPKKPPETAKPTLDGGQSTTGPNAGKGTGKEDSKTADDKAKTPSGPIKGDSKTANDGSKTPQEPTKGDSKTADDKPKTPQGQKDVAEILKTRQTDEFKIPEGFLKTLPGEFGKDGNKIVPYTQERQVLTDENPPDRDDHYFTGVSGCDKCEARCAKQSTGKLWPNCQPGAIRDSKETILKTLVLADGTRYVKIQIDREICNTVACHSYGNAIASPATGLKVCCTYKQWQKDSLTSWAYPVTDDKTGMTVSYKLDVSTPCSCGQLYDAALDAQLADGTYGRTKFVAAVAAACPNLPLSGIEAFLKSCKFFGQDVKIGGVDWNNLMNTVIGHLGASKGESGPGWSHPDPPKITNPTDEPAPGTKSGYPIKPK